MDIAEVIPTTCSERVLKLIKRRIKNQTGLKD
jgi:hypothetical protein